MKNINYIGMDVHKEKIVVAECRNLGEAKQIGEYRNDNNGVRKMINKFKEISNTHEVRTCYEAGPCGYVLRRLLNKNNIICEIIAPSLIPEQKGKKIKTDKRDAARLARLFAANELTFINVPDEEKECVRDLIRCREGLVDDIKKIKQRISHFLLRHGIPYEGSKWTKAHFEWLKKLKLEDQYAQVVLSQYFNQIESLLLHLKDLEKEIEKLAQTEPYKKKVTALSAFRGIGLVTAMILISEIVDFSRFKNPRELMAYLGVVPSEYSSGEKQSKGSITKCGNNRVRRCLVESSWHYRHQPVITKKMSRSLEQVDKELRVPPINALKRLNKKYYQLIYKGKSSQLSVVAVARELSGFIWHSMVLVEQADTQKLKAA